MQIDPTRWLVSLAGFVYDWLITREWRSILLSAIPLLLLATVAGLVWYGERLDREELAAWYLELGEQEIGDWEASWAPDVNGGAESIVEENQSEQDAAASAVVAENDVAAESDKAESDVGVSRFAEVLFRRVQLLSPSDRSQFVIGATLAQRGAYDQARKMLSKIAPEDRSGYAPAHAYLALIYLQQFRSTGDRGLIPALRHHAEIASKWDRAPEEILLAASDMHWADQDAEKSLRMLDQAAERNPKLWVEVVKRARLVGNGRLYEQSRENAERHLIKRIADEPKDDLARVQLAELMVSDQDGLDAAEKLLREGQQIDATPNIMRGLSEVYRLRFKKTVKQDDGVVSANINLLDQALLLDPTNPKVPEEVALLGRFNADVPSEDLVDTLLLFLAEGKATTATHAWLSEAYLIKENYAKALPHLEQLAIRLPKGAQYLNNLAWVLAETKPERIDEALEFAQRAVMASREVGEPNADFYDTLGKVLEKRNEVVEAIAAYESAIQLAPSKIQFHQSVAKLYRAQGNEKMAESHAKVIDAIRQRQAEQAAKKDAADATSSTEPTPKPSSEPSSGELDSGEVQAGSAEANEAPATSQIK